jgi:hypothetical protein
VLIPDSLGLEVLLVCGLVDLLEDVLEPSVVALQDGVLGAQVQGNPLVKSHLERRVGESNDGLISVVHGEGNTGTLVVEDLDGGLLPLLGGVDELDRALTRDNEVLGLVLVTVGVTADGDGLLPSGDQTGDRVNDNGLTENGTTEDVADGYTDSVSHEIR